MPPTAATSRRSSTSTTSSTLGIAQRARLPLLEKFLAELRATIRLMGLRAATHEGRLPEVLEEHEAILAALEAHDTKGALAAWTGTSTRTSCSATATCCRMIRRRRAASPPAAPASYYVHRGSTSRSAAILARSAARATL